MCKVAVRMTGIIYKQWSLKYIKSVKKERVTTTLKFPVCVTEAQGTVWTKSNEEREWVGMRVRKWCGSVNRTSNVNMLEGIKWETAGSVTSHRGERPLELSNDTY